MINKFDFEKIENLIGYSFKKRSLLKQAFTRSSYSGDTVMDADNEVLEFIGDSVLGMLVTKHISEYYRCHVLSEAESVAIRVCLEQHGLEYNDEGVGFECELDERQLSELKIAFVKRSSLSAAIERLGINQYLRVGKSDENDGVIYVDSVKEDLFEAIIGAIALDSGWDIATLEEIIERLLMIDHVLEHGFPGEPDYKALLADALGKRCERLEFEEFPSNCASLDFRCKVSGKYVLSDEFFGVGRTPEGARRMACKLAYESFVKNGERKNAILNAVGKPELDKAVNQLQELYQKGICKEPRYDYTQYPESENGNPQWDCEIVIEGEDAWRGPLGNTKKEAKKLAAYEMILGMMGVPVGQMWMDACTVTNNEKEKKDNE